MDIAHKTVKHTNHKRSVEIIIHSMDYKQLHSHLGTQPINLLVVLRTNKIKQLMNMIW